MKAMIEGTKFSNLFLITIKDDACGIQKYMNVEEIDSLILDLNGIKADILNRKKDEDWLKDYM
jgi:hypothetical protein